MAASTRSLGRSIRAVDEAISGVFDWAFQSDSNPWRHLGGLAFLFLIIVIVTGVIAFALYDTSVAGAYQSGLRLQNDSWLAGRLLRGLHRYGADAFLVTTVLHLVREAARGHFRGVRWYAWLTGLPLTWMIWIAGVAGFWLLWDQRAVYSLEATARWLQALPIVSDELARNFLTTQAMNDRFFSLILFVHIGVPLLLLAGVWIHVQRVTLPRMWPPRPLIIGALMMLSMLALLAPATSLGPARMGQVPAVLSLDWFYLFAHPLMDAISPAGLWVLVVGLTVALAALSAIPRRKEQVRAVAVVDLANCNGCSRCAADCPFGAVNMVPRTDGSRHAMQPVVVSDLCAGCGICVGSCPSATPFRSIEEIVSGIEMPDSPVAAMRRELQQKMAALSGGQPVVLFACSHAGELASLADHQTAVMTVECAAMLPPSFLEYATRRGATGVVAAGCRESDCEYRLGDQWFRQRFSGEREPRLRAAALRERMAVLWSGSRLEPVRAALAEMRRNMSNPAPGRNIGQTAEADDE